MGWLQWGGSGPDLQLFLSLASIWKWLCLHSLNPAKWSSGVQHIGEIEWMVNAGKVEIDRWRQAASVRLQLREGVQRKHVFFGRSFPNVGGWGGWFSNKVQTPQNLPKSPRKSPFSTRILPFVLPNLTKTLGWVNRFGRDLPKKKRCFTPSLRVFTLPFRCTQVKKKGPGPNQIFLSLFLADISETVPLR